MRVTTNFSRGAAAVSAVSVIAALLAIVPTSTAQGMTLAAAEPQVSLTRLDLAESPASPRLALRNSRALDPWRSTLRGHGLARLVMIGSSSTDGTLAASYGATIPMKLQTRLRADFALTGGLGYVPATPTTGGYLPNVPNTRAGRAVMWRHGLGGRSVTLRKRSHHVTYAPTPASSIRVYYGKTPSRGGGLKVLIDGVDQKVRLSSASRKARSSGHFWRSGTLKPGNHVVRIVPSVPRRIGILEGVEFINGDATSGVRVYNGAHSGATAAQYNSASAALHWQSVAAIRPDLVTVMLGANDIAAGTVAEFLSNIDAVLKKIPSGTPVLLLGSYLRGDYADAAGKAKWRKMQAGLAARAVNRVAYLDLAPYWPELVADGSTSAGLMVDIPAIHPSEAGRELLTQLIGEAIGR